MAHYLSAAACAVSLAILVVLPHLPNTQAANNKWGDVGVAMSAPGPACSAPLVLGLQPGQHWPGSRPIAIPADLPRSGATVELPLYPGAAPTTVQQAKPSFGAPLDPYLKSSSASYRSSGDLDAVMAWYRNAFPACGYSFQTTSTLTQRGQVVSHGLSWVKTQGRDRYRMSLSFATAPDSGTLILYVAIVYAPPIYPVSGSILRVPGYPSELTITRYGSLNPGYGALQPLRTVKINDAKVVNSLATEINDLPNVTVHVVSCPADDGSHLTLVFRDSGGSTHIVTVQASGCRFVIARPAPSGWLYSDSKLLPRLVTLVDGPGSRRAPAFYDARTLRPVKIRLLASNEGRFLSTGENGHNLLFLDNGRLMMAPAAGGLGRLLARGITDAALAIDDFTALASSIHAAHPRRLLVIDTKSGHRSSIELPPSASLIGRTAGIGPVGLSDAEQYNLQLVWYTVNRRVGGIDPEYPGTDRFQSAPFLPAPEPHQLFAISCSGALIAIYQPGKGVTIRQVGFDENGGGRLIRRLRPGSVSFLSWAPDDIHLAYRSGDRLLVTNVETGRTHRLLSLAGETVHGAAWDPWSHILAISVASVHAPASAARVELVNSGGSGGHILPLPFTGATTLRWSSFQGETIGLTRITPRGSEAWVVTLPPIPRDPGQPG